MLVPQALRVLDFRVTHVGSADVGVPPKGSTDRTVAEYSLSTNQVIVTKNHDMMTLCAEVRQRFVWLESEPFGSQRRCVSAMHVMRIGEIRRPANGAARYARPVIHEGSVV